MRHSRLIEENLLISTALSIATLIVVLGAFFLIAGRHEIRNMRRQAEATADEIADILSEPLYNIDDEQAARIAAALIASGRIASLRLESTVSGLVFERRAETPPRWIRAQDRRIERGELHLGDLRVAVSEREIRETLALYVLVSGLLAAATILVNATANLLFIRKRVRRAFADLDEGIRRINGGSLGYEIPSSGYRDLDSLIVSFNRMSRSVEASNAQLSTLNAELEERVTERTAELRTALDEQDKLRERLVEAAKLSVLGRLSTGMAHEINTPLGAIVSSDGYLIEFIENEYRSQLEFFAGLPATDRAAYERILAIGIAGNRGLSVSMAAAAERRSFADALGAAGVPDGAAIADELADLSLHGELRAVVEALSSSGRPLEIARRVAAVITAYRMARVIEEAGGKAAAVVSALRSHIGTSQDEPSAVDVHEEIRKSLTLMHGAIKYGVESRTELAPGRPMALAVGFDRVLVNLTRNAAQAMGFKGVLTIRTEIKGDLVIVSVIDTGTGVPPELADEIWKPFFTTKGNGEGLGLGLDICRKLVARSGGRIYFDSEPGNTAFHVELPRLDEA